MLSSHSTKPKLSVGTDVSLYRQYDLVSIEVTLSVNILCKVKTYTLLICVLILHYSLVLLKTFCFASRAGHRWRPPEWRLDPQHGDLWYHKWDRRGVSSIIESILGYISHYQRCVGLVKPFGLTSGSCVPTIVCNGSVFVFFHTGRLSDSSK